MKNLKKLRKEACLTQSQLSEFVGCSRSSIAQYETGKAYPRAELLPKLAQILNCTVDELLQGDKE